MVAPYSGEHVRQFEEEVVLEAYVEVLKMVVDYDEVMVDLVEEVLTAMKDFRLGKSDP